MVIIVWIFTNFFLGVLVKWQHSLSDRPSFFCVYTSRLFKEEFYCFELSFNSSKPVVLPKLKSPGWSIIHQLFVRKLLDAYLSLLRKRYGKRKRLLQRFELRSPRQSPTTMSMPSLVHIFDVRVIYMVHVTHHWEGKILILLYFTLSENFIVSFSCGWLWVSTNAQISYVL